MPAFVKMSVTLHQIQKFFLGALKKALLEENLVEPFLNSIFGVLSSPTEDEETLSDEKSLIGKSLITLRNMIDALPLDSRVIPVTVEFVETAICSWSAWPRKGACLAIGVVASCERVDTQCLSRLLTHVAVGIKDYHPAVRSAALFALHRLFFNIKVSLKLHADILEEPIYDCLTMLCNPPKSPISPPKIPDYIGTLFETVILLCGADDGNVVAEVFLSFLPKLIRYLLLASRYNVESRDRGIDVLHEVAQTTEGKTLSPVSQTAKAIETFLKSSPSDALPNKLNELWGIFEKLEDGFHQEEFNSLASKCLTLVMAAIRIVIADRVSLGWAYDLLPKLKFFLKPKGKEAIERIFNRQNVPVASVDGSFKVEKPVKRIVRKKTELNFVWLKRQKKKIGLNRNASGESMVVKGYSEVSDASRGNGIEENMNKVEVKEHVTSMGKAFKLVASGSFGNLVNERKILEGRREAPGHSASDNATGIIPVKPPFADEENRSPAANVERFHDMFALSPEPVPTENKTSLPRIPSPPPPPTITFALPLFPPPVPPSPLYTCDTPFSESHSPWSRSRTPSSRFRTLSIESRTPSVGSRTPSCTAAALVPTCPSAIRPTRSDSLSSLAVMWSSSSPPHLASTQSCPSPFQLSQPCPPPEPLDPPMVCPTYSSRSSKHCGQPSPTDSPAESRADQMTVRQSTGNSASVNTETCGIGDSSIQTRKTGCSDVRNIFKAEVISEDEQYDLNVDETALEGLKAIEDFQSDCDELFDEETDNEGETVASAFQVQGSASERRSTTQCGSLNANLVKEELLSESFLSKEEPLDGGYDPVVGQLEGNTVNPPSQTREMGYQSSPSEVRKSAASETPVQHLCVTINLPVIKREHNKDAPAEAESSAPGGPTKRVLRSSTQRTAGGDFLPIPTDFPTTFNSYRLLGNAVLSDPPSTCDSFSPGSRAKIKERECASASATGNEKPEAAVPLVWADILKAPAATTNCVSAGIMMSCVNTTTREVPAVKTAYPNAAGSVKATGHRSTDQPSNGAILQPTTNVGLCVSLSTQDEPLNLTVNKPTRLSALEVMSCVSATTKSVTLDVACVNPPVQKRTSETLSSHSNLSLSTPSQDVTNSYANINPETQNGASALNDTTQKPAQSGRESAISLASMSLSGDQCASASAVTLNPFSCRVEVKEEHVTLDEISYVANSEPPGVAATQALCPCFDDAKIGPRKKKNVGPSGSLKSIVDVSGCFPPPSCVKKSQKVTQNAILSPPATTQPVAPAGIPYLNNSVQSRVVPNLVQCFSATTRQVAPAAILCANTAVPSGVPNVIQCVRGTALRAGVATTAIPFANEPVLSRMPNRVECCSVTAQQVAPTAMLCFNTSTSALAPSDSSTCIDKPTLNVLPNTVQCVKTKTHKVAPYVRSFDGSPTLTSMVPHMPPSTMTSSVPRKGGIVSQVVNKEEIDEDDRLLKSDGKKQIAGGKAHGGDNGHVGNTVTLSDPLTVVESLSDEDKSCPKKTRKCQSKSCAKRRPESKSYDKKKWRSIRKSRLALVSYSSSDSSLSSSVSRDRRSPCSSPSLSRKLCQRCGREPSARKHACTSCTNDNQSRRKRSRSRRSSRSRSKCSRSRSGSRSRSKRSRSENGCRSRDGGEFKSSSSGRRNRYGFITYRYRYAFSSAAATVLQRRKDDMVRGLNLTSGASRATS